MPHSAFGQSPYDSAECWTLNGIGKAPSNNDLSLVLEPVRAVPDGVLFPAATARYTLWKLHCLRSWPEMAQAKLDEQKMMLDFQLERERDLGAKLRNEIMPPPQEGFSLSTVITVGAVSFGIGSVLMLIMLR